MQRVLDLDLDFFVQPVVSGPLQHGQRPSQAEHDLALGFDTALSSINVEVADPLDAAMHYLRERALLTGPLPGAAVEHHDEVFCCWETMIGHGVLSPPFHVTHVDAHGDFGLGQATHWKVFDLLKLPLAQRPDRSRASLNWGNYLVHAVACQWVGTLDYVYCPGGGCDIPDAYWENFDRPNWNGTANGSLRLAPLDKTTFGSIGTPWEDPPTTYIEPPVRFRGIQQREYTASKPFDLVFLSRSPDYAPQAADRLFDAIQTAFIVPT